jgi:hypothetical protein
VGALGVWGPYMESERGVWDAGHRVRVVVIHAERARRAQLAWPLWSRQLRGRWQANKRGRLVREKRVRVCARASTRPRATR